MGPLTKTYNERPIRELHVVNLQNHIYYRFTKLEGTLGVNNLSLVNIDEQYQLEFLNRKVPLSTFKLIPGLDYKISNLTYGDAAVSDFKIKIDQKGNIIFATKIACE